MMQGPSGNEAGKEHERTALEWHRDEVRRRWRENEVLIHDARAILRNVAEQDRRSLGEGSEMLMRLDAAYEEQATGSLRMLSRLDEEMSAELERTERRISSLEDDDE